MKYPIAVPQSKAQMKVSSNEKAEQPELRVHFKQQLLMHVLDTTSESLMVTDANNKIVRINRAFIEMTGYSEEEALGQTPRLVQSTHHDAVFYQQMWQQLLATGSWCGQIWNRRKCGEVYLQQLTIKSLVDGEGVTTHHVALGRDLTGQRRVEDTPSFFTLKDPLTQLGNRHLLTSRLEQALAEGGRHQIRVGLLVLDLGRLRSINEELGLILGDEVLCRQAEKLSLVLDKADTLVRLQGDMFAILRHSHADDLPMAQLANKLLELLAAPLTLSGGIQVNLQPSIGIAAYPRDGLDNVSLLQAAEHAHSMAKRNGRQCFQFVDLQQHELHHRELLIEHSLQEVLSASLGEGLKLHYQPQVCPYTGEIQAIEALLRWQHGKLGALSPAEFIPIAEQSGQSVNLDRWVIKQVCMQIALWAQQFTPLPVVSINLSAQQLTQSDFAYWMQTCVATAGVHASAIKLEVTESTMMEPNCALMLDELRSLGFKVSLDDFGTGYSALASLHKFSFDELKIDRSFMVEASHSERALLLLKTVVQLAQQLSLSLVIEGVETQAQLDLLADFGPLTVQGYYFYKPLSVKELTQLFITKQHKHSRYL